MDDGAFGRELVDQRAFLISLARKKWRLITADAEDLVQDTLTKAWAAREGYVEQANLRAWLVIIMINNFLSLKRRGGRVIYTDDPLVLDRQGMCGGQEERVYLREVCQVLAYMDPDQVESMLLISAGNSYELAGEILGIANGTVKSRVARGRRLLRSLLKDEKVSLDVEAEP